MSDPRSVDGARGLEPASRGTADRGRGEAAVSATLMIHAREPLALLLIDTDREARYGYRIEAAALRALPAGRCELAASTRSRPALLAFRAARTEIAVRFDGAASDPSPVDLVARARVAVFATVVRVDPDGDAALAMLHGDVTRYDGDRQLWQAFRLSVQPLGIEIPARIDGRPSDWLRAPERRDEVLALAELHSQGWIEFTAATGPDVPAYLPLGFRLVEQYHRGNFNARQNRLEVRSHGVLGPGIYMRGEPQGLPLYWADGLVALRMDGSTPRDLGFLSDFALGTRIVVRVRNAELASILLESTKFAEQALDQRHTLVALVTLSELLLREVRRDWDFGAEVKQALAEQFEITIRFLAIESLAVVLTVIPAPQTRLLGLLVKAGARAGELALSLLQKLSLALMLHFVGRDVVLELYHIGNYLRQVEVETIDGVEVPKDERSRFFLARAVVHARRLIVTLYSTAAMWAVMNRTQRFVAFVFSKFPPMPPGAAPQLQPATAGAGGGRAPRASASAEAIPGGTADVPAPGPYLLPRSKDGSGPESSEPGGTGGEPEPGRRGGERGRTRTPREEPSPFEGIAFEPLTGDERFAADAPRQLEQRVAARLKEYCKAKGLPAPFQNVGFATIVDTLLSRVTGGPRKSALAAARPALDALLGTNRRAILAELGLGDLVAALELFYARRAKGARWLLDDVRRRDDGPRTRRERDLLDDLERWDPAFDDDGAGAPPAREPTTELEIAASGYKEAVRLQRELGNSLQVKLRDARPDNIVATQDLSRSALLDPTERLKDPMHQLKLLADFEVWLRIVEIVGPLLERPPPNPRSPDAWHVAGEILPTASSPALQPMDATAVRGFILRWFGQAMPSQQKSVGLDPAMVEIVKKALAGGVAAEPRPGAAEPTPAADPAAGASTGNGRGRR